MIETNSGSKFVCSIERGHFIDIQMASSGFAKTLVDVKNDMIIRVLSGFIRQIKNSRIRNNRAEEKLN